MAVRPDVLLHELNKTLNRMPRTGWVDHQVLFPESIGAHQNDVKKIVAFHAPLFLSAKDAKRALELAPRHDMHEGVARLDLTPAMGFSKQEIQALTLEAVKALWLLPRFGTFIGDAILEFEEGATIAARFAGEADRLQMSKEALLVEKTNRSPWSMQPFFDYVGIKLQNSPLYETFLAIEKQRPEAAKDKPVLCRKPLSPHERSALLGQAQAHIASFRRKLGHG